MTDWYWQNQQLVYLEKWQREGLVNICDVKNINHIKPLLFVHRNQGAEHEDSMVVLSIKAKMQDYLQEQATGKVIEGSKNIRMWKPFGLLLWKMACGKYQILMRIACRCLMRK